MESIEVGAVKSKINLHQEWLRELGPEFEKPYMIALRRFLSDQMKMGRRIFPKGSNIFNALNTTPLSQVKVVIIGQDPYHGLGQAHGLCFSVQSGVRPPPSLENIFKELCQDLGIEKPKAGDLTKWAQQGVLLLNTCLTVEEGKPLSHRGRGWETFTDRIIEVLNEQQRPIVFLLWGAPAQKKELLITNKIHFVLKAPHPSPLSAHRGFFGCRHFSKTNELLKGAGQIPIDWNL